MIVQAISLLLSTLWIWYFANIFDTLVTKFALSRNGFKLASIILIYLMELSREWLYHWSTYNKLDSEMLLVEQATLCLIVWSLMKWHEIFFVLISKLFFSPWKFSNFNWYLLVILRRKHLWSKIVSIDVFFGINTPRESLNLNACKAYPPTNLFGNCCRSIVAFTFIDL